MMPIRRNSGGKINNRRKSGRAADRRPPQQKT
jgi:hypothetical protein